MSFEKDFFLPTLGDGDGSGRVVAWLVEEGNTFRKGDALLEVETDKAVVEVPAEDDGELIGIVVPVDEMAEQGNALARIRVEGDPPAEAPEPEAAKEQIETRPEVIKSEPPAPAVGGRSPAKRIVATPLARRLAVQHGIDLANLNGTGKKGRIQRDDVLGAVDKNDQMTTRPGTSASRSRTIIDESTGHVKTASGEIAFREWTPSNQSASALVILIHGLFADTDVWSASATVLAREGARVLAFDLPNHGQSGSDDIEFEDVVSAIHEATNKRVRQEPVVVCGHSYGAAIAARLSRMADINCTGLCLISPIGMGTEINQAFLDGMTGSRSLPALQREMGKLTSAGTFLPGDGYLTDLLKRLESRYTRLTGMCDSVAWQGIQQIDITQALSNSNIPTKVIWGRRDDIIPWKHALAAPASAALHLVPDVGHMPQWEASALTQSLLGDMLGT